MWSASGGLEGFGGVNSGGLWEAPAVSSYVSCFTVFVVASTSVGHAAGVEAQRGYGIAVRFRGKD